MSGVRIECVTDCEPVKASEEEVARRARFAAITREALSVLHKKLVWPDEWGVYAKARRTKRIGRWTVELRS